MIRTTLMFAAATSLLRVCGRDANPPPPTIAAIGAMPAMMPEHGGAVAMSGGLMTEVSPLPDGRIVAYVRDANRAPVQPNDVEVSVRKPDGTLEPVSVTYDPQMQGYVGRPSGLVAGTYPVEVAVRAAPAAPPVQLVTPPVTIVATVVPQARYGGRVQVVGNDAVETVVAADGNVAMFWMDLNGVPIPASQVQVPSITVTVNGTPHTVVPRIENDHFIAHVQAAPSATVIVAAPQVVVRGVRYRRMYSPATPVFAVMPPAIYVGGPSVVVAPPFAPTVVVQPPMVGGVYVEGPGHFPHGRARGYWGNGGGAVVVGAPGVVVGAPGVVVVGGGGGWRGRGDGDDDHGRGGGWGHGEGGGGGWHGGGGGGGGHGHGH